MFSNVLPSAPHDEPGLYPELPQHDFRMQKAKEVSAALNAEVVHYRGVAKKYKRAKKTTNWFAAGSGLFSTACSTVSFGYDLLLLLWAFLLQFHLAELVVYSLLLPQV